ncbi:MAG: RdgB/HAM1 family non-canonical purine NTP pyrophosphatase [Planctomycetota bacterium]|nr:RdgB/HAM1 family non-canonical purine NTP pyrophosphatase [Planctomycetota bacterium]
MKSGPILVATTNAHKAAEIAAILAPTGLEVRPAPFMPHVVEDGDTFRANAILKACAAAAAHGLPALADDSGLAVDILGGEPGIHSARYAGERASDADNNALLIERLEALGAREPSAAFVCHLVIALPDGSLVAEAEGRVEGLIRWPARGAGGFGYDPLFFHPPSGCSLAELDPAAKNAISHRGRALRALTARLS